VGCFKKRIVHQLRTRVMFLCVRERARERQRDIQTEYMMIGIRLHQSYLTLALALSRSLALD
jgi:hypothetical protein